MDPKLHALIKMLVERLVALLHRILGGHGLVDFNTSFLCLRSGHIQRLFDSDLLHNSRLFRDSFRRTIGNGYTKGPYTYTRLRIAKGVCPIPGTGMRALRAQIIIGP